MFGGLMVIERWQDRVLRQIGRVDRYLSDAARSLDWHVGGGRRFFGRYAPHVASAHTWCFIVGCNNSGTTLLHSLLRKFPDTSTFEREGQIHTRVLVRANRKGHERVWTEYLDDLRLTEADPVGPAARLLHDWARELPVPANRIVVEKTTANAVRMRWLQRAFPDSHFIGIVRNGYAVAEGIRRKGGKSLQRAARHWDLVNRIMLADASRLERFLLVQYEDLTADVSGTVGRIAAFLETEPPPASGGEIEVITGSQRGPVRDLNAKSLSRLSDEDMRIVETEASEMLGRFGYLRR